MAHLHSGIMGPVSGKVGNLVYYTYRGKCFVRRAPGKRKRRPTLKQKVQTTKFGLAIRFISPLSRLINPSYRLINKRKIRTNMLTRDILREAIIGQYPKFDIDYSRVSLIQGTLPWSGGSLSHSGGSSSFGLSWRVLDDGRRMDDELVVLIYCCTTGNWFVVDDAAQRAQGNCNFQMESPVDGGKLQVWMAFRSADHMAYSNSEFLGEVVTHKTPSYED